MQASSNKPRILVFSRFFLPGSKGGGPIRSVSNLVSQLADEFEFLVVCGDRDLGESKAYPGIAVNEWQEHEGARVMYIRPRLSSIHRIWRVLRNTPHDLLYLNSFFDPVFSLAALLAKRFGVEKAPILLAPRGEFSAGALQIRYTKKRAYIRFLGFLRMYRLFQWHASTDKEVAEISAELGGNVVARTRFHSAVNLATRLDLSESQLDEADRARCEDFRICFFSRIVPKKNLDYALRVLTGVSLPVKFDIFGSIEDTGYWRECQKLLAGLPSHITARHCGAIAHEELAVTLSPYRLFFFPTRGENFGHVIHESLQCGLPVLISDQTPWQALESAGAGWSLALDDEQAFADVIDRVAAWTSQDIVAARRSAIEHARLHGMDADARADNVRMFASAIAEKYPA